MNQRLVAETLLARQMSWTGARAAEKTYLECNEVCWTRQGWKRLLRKWGRFPEMLEIVGLHYRQLRGWRVPVVSLCLLYGIAFWTKSVAANRRCRTPFTKWAGSRWRCFGRWSVARLGVVVCSALGGDGGVVCLQNFEGPHSKEKHGSQMREKTHAYNRKKLVPSGCFHFPKMKAYEWRMVFQNW